MAAANRDVFINCPFDLLYQPLFRAIVFTVIRSGFQPRCALEADDGGENRFEKICSIIGQCRYGIHDISRTELTADAKLPRFNMPLELGLFLGAKRFGGRFHKTKCCIIFDVQKYRFQQFISDIAGQDIHAHENNVVTLITELAGWLRNESGDRRVPGSKKIRDEFDAFPEGSP